MPALNFQKLTALPATLQADTFYFIKNASGAIAESYLTDSTGTAYAIGNSAMVQALVAGVVADQIARTNRVEIVATIAARNALSAADRNQMVLVENATGDASVSSGSALYVFRNSDDAWVKVAEYESMDVSLTWAAISGKPTSAPSQIDDAVNKRHSHANLGQLDKIGENASGKMTYSGAEVGGTSAEWSQTAW